MSSVSHPFASAGGGTLFEYKVATLLTRDLILTRQTRFGGLIEAVALQSGPRGFDDLTISLDLRNDGARVVHMQCRYRQSFAGSNPAFAELIADASAALSLGDQDKSASATEDKRLAIIVDSDSPAHKSMARLCRLARTAGNLEHFLGVIARHQGEVQQRWNHCIDAAGDLSHESLHQVLAKLEVRSYSLDSDASDDSLELVNQLAEAWDRPNHDGALNLANAVFRLVCDLGPSAGVVDVGVLQAKLGSLLPFVPGADTRRERLRRKREASRLRIWDSLSALRLDEDEAEMLTTQVLTTPPRIEASGPITVASGPMGVGKSTELERLHCAAIDAARENRNAPIPIFATAAEIGHMPLLDALSRHVEGLGDPSRVGVHLVIDSLDEASVQVGALTAGIATMRAEWPNSTVLLGTRPQETPRGVEYVTVEPMTPEAAQSLMKTIDPDIVELVWFPEELAEVLRVPLFAIQAAVDHRDGHGTGLDRGQLVASVGKRALDDLGGDANAVASMLARLACRIVEGGGRLVDPRDLDLRAAEVARLAQLPIVQTVGGKLSFQLAILTEWFAADALLHDPEVLERSVSSPLRAHRWRYVFAQALLQGSAGKVDLVMSTLLDKVPATAGWVLQEALASEPDPPSTPLDENILEAGARVRDATQAWLGPCAFVAERWTDDGELPTLGIHAERQWLTTAWQAGEERVLEPVVHLPPGVHPLTDVDDAWTGTRSGTATGGEAWPWEWARDEIRKDIEDCLEGRELLADIAECRPELAWDYAHAILGRDDSLRSQPIRRADLEAVIARHRSTSPIDDVTSVGGSRWTLSEGESFVADLVRVGMEEIEPPWMPADPPAGGSEPQRESERLLARLELVTKAALDIYQAIVERHLPEFAPALNTYLLLPGRVVGMVIPPDPKRGFAPLPRCRWRIEPLPAGSANKASWSVWDSDNKSATARLEDRWEQLRTLRGNLAERMTLGERMSKLAFATATPASTYALELLWKDLARFGWVERLGPNYSQEIAIRPRFD